MKRFGWLFLAVGLVGGAAAQDLDTVTIGDQFNVGDRGNDIGSLASGGSKIDGSEFEDYNGTDFTASITTSARYINSWGTDGTPESPVVTVTSPMNNPDRFLTGNIPAIAANTRPGATGGSTALQVGDDGGFNAIYVGESDDRNYFIEVDVYCAHSPATDPADYEVAGITARNARDNDTSVTDFTYNPDRQGSYAIQYDYQLKEVRAVKWRVGNTSTQVQTRAAGSYTQFGATITGVTEGWHTMRIDCKDARIEFKFDGNVIANVVDTTFTHGRPGMWYREFSVDSALEKQALFDNLRAGPSPLVSSVSDWSVY